MRKKKTFRDHDMCHLPLSVNRIYSNCIHQMEQRMMKKSQLMLNVALTKYVLGKKNTLSFFLSTAIMVENNKDRIKTRNNRKTHLFAVSGKYLVFLFLSIFLLQQWPSFNKKNVVHKITSVCCYHSTIFREIWCLILWHWKHFDIQNALNGMKNYYPPFV